MIQRPAAMRLFSVVPAVIVLVVAVPLFLGWPGRSPVRRIGARRRTPIAHAVILPMTGTGIADCVTRQFRPLS